MAINNPENDQAQRLREKIWPKNAEPQVPLFDRKQRMKDEGRGGRGFWSDQKTGVVDPSTLPGPIPSGIEKGRK